MFCIHFIKYLSHNVHITLALQNYELKMTCGPSGLCYQTEELVRESEPEPCISELRTVGVRPTHCLTLPPLEYIAMALH